MPVYWFALSFSQNIDWFNAILIGAILHLLLYPASNGYNSYMDRDTSSIGGIEKPMLPSYQLFIASVLMDVLGILLTLIINPVVTASYCCYILFSRLYSWRKIRLKKYAILGYITVIINQGALVFFMVSKAVNSDGTLQIPFQLLIVSSLLIGGFYPITQIYQHEQDKADGVNTLSLLLGKRGTFVFCLVLYISAFTILFFYFKSQAELNHFFLLQVFFLPVVVNFLSWFYRVWNNEFEANFKQTMRMNWIAGICTNAAFISLLILKYFG